MVMSEFCEFYSSHSMSNWLNSGAPSKAIHVYAFFGKEYAQLVLVGMLSKIEACNTPSLSVLIHIYFIYCNNYT